MFVCFRLKEGRDDELIQWLKNIEEDRSYHIREALRRSLKSGKKEKPRPAEKESAPAPPAQTDGTDLEVNLDSWLNL